MINKSPTIVLRKGKTELTIRNSAAIIKKIDEMFPNNDYNTIAYARQINDEEKVIQRKWMKSAKDWFKTEFFGGTEESFEVFIEDMNSDESQFIPNEESKYIVENKKQHIKTDVEPELRSFSPSPPELSTIKSVNANAYEIRLDVLKAAISFLTWTTECERDKGQYKHVPSSNEAMELAQKFYKFVENKR